MGTPDYINKITNGDHLDILPKLDNNSIDLVVTSPPYDAIRDYTNGNAIDRKRLGQELFRVVKDGGVCAVVIQDGTSNFRKSGTTARWQVEWLDLGWNLFECCIYSRNGRPGAWWNQRFRVDHEYILIFFKGERPKFFDKEPLKIKTKYAGTKWHGTQRRTDGTLEKNNGNILADLKCRGTIWHYNTTNTEGDKLKLQHPAPFPEALARDIILCFSKEGDSVLDPCVGSGTVAVQARATKRNYVGIDLSPEYCKLAEERISKVDAIF